MDFKQCLKAFLGFRLMTLSCFLKRGKMWFFSTLVTQWFQRSESLDDITSRDCLQNLGGTVKLNKECSYFYSQSSPQCN